MTTKGWAYVDGVEYAHYFNDDAQSLCGQHGPINGSAFDTMHDHPENCAACQKKRAEMQTTEQPTLSGSKQAYTLTEADFDAELRERGAVPMVPAQAFQGATAQYIDLLEQRVKDLETIIKVVNEPVGRDVTTELGHVRGLDALQYFDSAWKEDETIGRLAEYKGYRANPPFPVTALEALGERGFIGGTVIQAWITEKGRNYLTTLKQEVFGK